MEEEKKDLFDLDDNWALAHCVGADFIMGKGIAVEFKKRFGNQKWLIDQNKKVGETILMSKKMVGKNIFYLITKKWSRYSKPTYEDIEKCLVNMFEIATKHNINKIGIPKLGCGLDGKDWNIVKSIIIKHKPKNIEIVVRYL